VIGGTLSPYQRKILKAMEIPVWVTQVPADEPAAPSVPTGEGCADWEALEQAVPACEQCGLHRTRTQTVFGVGNRDADWMIVGEAPGADEDRQGEPFVGKAGLLLNEMLRAAGFGRSDVYIANILKCRPPNNRDPEEAEVEACAGFLNRQIELISPRLILAVGRIAAQNLLHQDLPVGRLRGTVHRYADTGIPVVVTYHPAYLLRSPSQKRKAWADLLLARSVTAQPAP
jgi:uracil-DNA glycosylase family 4